MISFHADLQHIIYFTPKISGYFGSFRMPLYFVLSGLFVSFRGGKKLFIQKKINKLIVPFCFFVFLTNLIAWIIKDLMHGYENGVFASKFEWVSPIQVAYYEFAHSLNNMPLWFLVCLFNAYIFYMLIDHFSYGKLWIKALLSILAGACGLLFSTIGINIPFHIDSALWAVPFIFTGEMIRRKTSLLLENKYDKWNILVCVVIFSIMIFTTPNYFNEHQNFIQYYFNGICGAVAILLLCKQIKRLPVISYIGRYSIIFLCLHQMLVGHVTNIVSKFFTNAYAIEFSTITIIVCICLLATTFFTKYLPWFCAQKDILYFIEPQKQHSYQ